MTEDLSDNTETSLIDRRSYLKYATSAASIVALGAQSATAAEDYDVIEVSRGETYRKSLSNGETWENVLIDISASGAGYSISATGNNWKIRNVGIKGQWDYEPSSSPFVVRVDSSNSTGLIENFYLADGTTFDRGPASNPTGIYVHGKHSGTLTIRNVNIQQMADNGIYASSPGTSHDGTRGGGEVHIENSYCSQNSASDFRLGSDGSTITNCCAWNGDSRGFWALFSDDITVSDCDFNAKIDIRVGSNSQEGAAGRYGEITVTNTRFDTTSLERSQNSIHGSSAGSPTHRGPEELGAPTSAEEAAGGQAVENPTFESDPDPEPEFPEDDHLLAFVTESDARLAAYEFETKDAVEFTKAPYESPSGNSIEGGTYSAKDFIDEHGETVRAGGVTGGGYGDAYLVQGPVTSIDIRQPDVMWVELDGERMSPEEVIEKLSDNNEDINEADDRLLSFVTEPEATYADTAEYSFEVSGSIEKATHQDATIDGDSINGTTVEGTVDGSKDAYWFSGDITDFWLNGNALVNVEYDVRD